MLAEEWAAISSQNVYNGYAIAQKVHPEELAKIVIVSLASSSSTHLSCRFFALSKTLRKVWKQFYIFFYSFVGKRNKSQMEHEKITMRKENHEYNKWNEMRFMLKNCNFSCNQKKWKFRGTCELCKAKCLVYYFESWRRKIVQRNQSLAVKNVKKWWIARHKIRRPEYKKCREVSLRRANRDNELNNYFVSALHWTIKYQPWWWWRHNWWSTSADWFFLVETTCFKPATQLIKPNA